MVFRKQSFWNEDERGEELWMTEAGGTQAGAGPEVR